MDRYKEIMVVDDEAGIRALLFDILSGAGFKVTLATDGQDSLNQMENHRFDLLITDVNMPRVDGFELLKRMKTAGREERVIVMTGNPLEEESLGEALPAVYRLLHKPFPIHSFLEVVNSALA